MCGSLVPATYPAVDCFQSCSLGYLGTPNVTVQFGVTSLNAIGYSESLSAAPPLMLVPGTPAPPTITTFAGSLDVIGDFYGEERGFPATGSCALVMTSCLS